MTDRGWMLFACAVGVASLLFYAALIWTVIHFIEKFW